MNRSTERLASLWFEGWQAGTMGTRLLTGKYFQKQDAEAQLLLTAGYNEGLKTRSAAQVKAHSVAMWHNKET